MIGINGKIDFSFPLASPCAGYQNCGCYRRSILVLLQDAETKSRLGSIFEPSLGEARFGSTLLPCSESSVMRNSNRGPFSAPCSQGIDCVSQASFPIVLTSYKPVLSNSL